MRGINKAIILGNVGKTPLVATTSSGATVLNFSVATSESWKDKNGERQEKTEWHYISAFGKMADSVSQFIEKGSQVYIEGRIQTSKYKDKDGVEKYKTQINADKIQVLSSSKKTDSGDFSLAVASAGGGDFFDDDIPF